MTTTQRGFSIKEFTDRYGAKCSIQKSSLAFEDCIWLGIDNPNPQIMAAYAIKMGIVSEDTKPEGWIPFDIPKEVMINTRMHLTRDQVNELLPILQKFVLTGEI